jgi:hypothetical protein
MDTKDGRKSGFFLNPALEFDKLEELSDMATRGHESEQRLYILFTFQAARFLHHECVAMKPHNMPHHLACPKAFLEFGILLIVFTA